MNIITQIQQKKYTTTISTTTVLLPLFDQPTFPELTKEKPTITAAALGLTPFLTVSRHSII